MATSTHLVTPLHDPAGGGRLENYANNSSARDRRRLRHAARSGLWRHSTVERCRKCGRVSRRHDGGAEYRKRDGHAGIAGLVSCGSVWVCPVCNAKVMQRRAFELGALVALAQSAGYVVGEITLTLRHSRTDRLAVLWGSLSTCWDRAKSGRQWTAATKAHGIVGWVRVVEVTQGRNGWHPHVHALVICERLDADGLDVLGAGMVERWARCAVRLGLDAPLSVGQEWHVLGDGGESSISEYLTASKSYGVTQDTATAIGLELTQTQSKRARSAFSTSSTWDLLDQANNGEVVGLRLWREFERASNGKRQISYSRGIRELLGLDLAELTDDEIAAEELGTEDDAGLVITSVGWARMVANPDWIPESLTVLEVAGWPALSAFLVEHQVDHVRIGGGQ